MIKGGCDLIVTSSTCSACCKCHKLLPLLTLRAIITLPYEVKDAMFVKFNFMLVNAGLH